MSDTFFWLSDEAWEAIAPCLPRNRSGARRLDDRRVMSGIVHVLTTGCRWNDCPAVYGSAALLYNRYFRWSRRPFWPRLMDTLTRTGAMSKRAAAAASPSVERRMNARVAPASRAPHERVSVAG